MPLLIGFSGQGNQHAAMFRHLGEDPWGRQWLEQAGTILERDLLDESVVAEACNDTIQVQILTVILSVGLFRCLNQKRELQPAFLCGYSLGEVSAFCASSNMALPELCALTRKRAQTMLAAAEKSGQGEASGLVVLKGNINKAKILELINESECYLAIMNGEDHFIIGGCEQHLENLLQQAMACSVTKAEKLKVNLPSHTPMLQAATTQYAEFLSSYATVPMHCPILACLTQELVFNSGEMIAVLARELSETLYWNRLMSVAVEQGITRFLELGPRSALKNMFATSFPQVRSYSMEDFSSIEKAVDYLHPIK